jgi:hypothetical protein
MDREEEYGMTRRDKKRGTMVLSLFVLRALNLLQCGFLLNQIGPRFC